MVTAVVRSHDALYNRMNLDALAVSPQARLGRRHNPKPSPPLPKVVAAAISVSTAGPQAGFVSATGTEAGGRRGLLAPPAKPARKQPSLDKEKPR